MKKSSDFPSGKRPNIIVPFLTWVNIEDELKIKNAWPSFSIKKISQILRLRINLSGVLLNQNFYVCQISSLLFL